MIYHEYDSDGFLIGWHEDAERANSTTIPPDTISPARARWNGTEWVEDASREQAAAQAVLLRAVANEIRRRLDALAQSWSYDSILSLATYRDSTVPQFAAEAAAGAAWRDAAWAYAEANKTANITPEQFWSGFPPAPERPTV